MKEAVTRTRENLSEKIDQVVAFTKEIDRATLDDLEAILITADLGTKTTQELLGESGALPHAITICLGQVPNPIRRGSSQGERTDWPQGEGAPARE